MPVVRPISKSWAETLPCFISYNLLVVECYNQIIMLYTDAPKMPLIAGTSRIILDLGFRPDRLDYMFHRSNFDLGKSISNVCAHTRVHQRWAIKMILTLNMYKSA